MKPVKEKRRRGRSGRLDGATTPSRPASRVIYNSRVSRIFHPQSVDIVVRMRRENASGCGRRHTGDRGDLADRSTRKELTLFSVSFISLGVLPSFFFVPSSCTSRTSCVIQHCYERKFCVSFTLRNQGRAIIPHPHEREKKEKVCFPYQPAGRGRGYGMTLVIHDGLLLSRMAVTTD